MEFLRSFLRLHFAGKPVVASRNVSCFLRFKIQYDVYFSQDTVELTSLGNRYKSFCTTETPFLKTESSDDVILVS